MSSEEKRHTTGELEEVGKLEEAKADIDLLLYHELRAGRLIIDPE